MSAVPRTARVRALVLAAGLGERLRPLTDESPKCLVPFLGRPLLDYWMSHLADAGVHEVAVNVHAHADRVEAYLERVATRGGLEITRLREPELLGSAGTLAANRDFLAGADLVLVVYADNLSSLDLASMLDFHRGHPLPATVALFAPPDLSATGVAVLDEAGTIVEFEEKPARPRGTWANAGVYVFDRAILDELEAGDRDIGGDLLPRLVGRMRGWTWHERHVDIGTPEAYAAARRGAEDILARRGFDGAGNRAAVFLDRDGTLIEHVHYLDDPGQVRLLPGAAESIAALRRAGYATVVVTNQSAVGRGILTEEGLHRIHGRFRNLLAERGAAVDGIYYSTFVPGSGDRTEIEHPDRKPGPGLLQRAADELGLDLSSSWMVGDMLSDALAGRNAGLRGSLLVQTGVSEPANGGEFPILADMPAVAAHILRHDPRRGSA